MFRFLKSDPKKKLQKQYDELTQKAFHAQRNGDIRTYSTMTADAEAIKTQLNAMDTDD